MPNQSISFLVIVLTALTTGAAAPPVFQGLEFEPLPRVVGISGEVVPMSVRVLGRFVAPDTKELTTCPLSKVKIHFEAHCQANPRGTQLVEYGIVGRPVVTDAQGRAEIPYVCPPRATRLLVGRYRAVYPGGPLRGVDVPRQSGDVGQLIIRPKPPEAP